MLTSFNKEASRIESASHSRTDVVNFSFPGIHDQLLVTAIITVSSRPSSNTSPPHTHILTPKLKKPEQKKKKRKPIKIRVLPFVKVLVFNPSTDEREVKGSL